IVTEQVGSETNNAQVAQCTKEEDCLPNGSVAEAESQTIVSSIKIRRIHIVEYENEYQMVDIMRLITKVLSEPYSIYTYRYFIHNWPKLCLLRFVPRGCQLAVPLAVDFLLFIAFFILST
ncbi:unnamed protein product, partial [Onchocerca flexuosa]|uniref:N-alpha-acetyltransferase 30 n=1 Tax=Onchocerca flexuosa TaxID=387005 RepID=A0A183HVF1_9BILA